MTLGVCGDPGWGGGATDEPPAPALPMGASARPTSSSSALLHLRLSGETVSCSCPCSEPPRNQPIHGLRRVVELLIRGVAVARFHFRDQPAVVTHFRHCGADSRPVVVAQKEIRVDTLIPAAPAMLQHVLQMNARDPRPVDLDPLFGKSGVVDVTDVEMDADGSAVHIVEELPEFARADQETLLGVAILATDLDTGAGGLVAQWLERIDAALIDLVVRDLFRHEPGHQQDRVGAKEHGGFDLSLD